MIALLKARTALNAGLPFFVHVTPVLPHWTTCYGPFDSLDQYAYDDPHREMQELWPISPCATPRHQEQFAGACFHSLSRKNPCFLGAFLFTCTNSGGR